MPSPARCNMCSEVFPSKNKASEHAKSAGHLPVSCIRVCTGCDATFTGNAEQREHAETTGHMKISQHASSLSAWESAANVVNRPVCWDCDLPFPNETILAEVRFCYIFSLTSLTPLPQHRRVAHPPGTETMSKESQKRPTSQWSCPNTNFPISMFEIQSYAVMPLILTEHKGRGMEAAISG